MAKKANLMRFLGCLLVVFLPGLIMTSNIIIPSGNKPAQVIIPVSGEPALEDSATVQPTEEPSGMPGFEPTTVPAEDPTVLVPTATVQSTLDIQKSVVPAEAASEDEVGWKIEIDTSMPAPEVSAQGGDDTVKTEMLNNLQEAVKGQSVTVDVQSTGTSKGSDNYTLSAQGNSTLDQFRKVVFDDFTQQADLLGGTVSLTINGTAANQGEAIPLLLESNPSTGSSWSVVGLDQEVLNQEGETSFEANGNSLLGAPMKQIINLREVGSGSTAITMVYNRPWEVSAQSIPSRRITLDLGNLPETIDLTNPEPPQLAEQGMEAPGPNPVVEAEGGTGSALPSSFDWRNVNGTSYVTPIKNQAQCGSCWAFSMVGTMEAALKRTGVSTDLSEQFLVSCTSQSNIYQYNYGCNGGYLDSHRFHYNTLAYNQSAPGAVLETDMPYTATNGSCTKSYTKPYVLSSWNYVTGNWWTKPTDDQIKAAIYNHGPVSAAVCVGNGFQWYKSGIFNTDESGACSGGTNHAIVLVGWGTDSSIRTYWILRNSWGTSWGENGYMRIATNASQVGTETGYVVYGDGLNPLAPITTNDNFDYATTVTLDGSGSYQASQSSTDATVDSTDPTFPDGLTRNSTVWFKITPAQGGLLDINTFASDYNTVLGIWSGAKGSLTNLAWNNDSSETVIQSEILVKVIGGKTYYIEAAGSTSGGGSLHLSVNYSLPEPVPSGTYDDGHVNFYEYGNWSTVTAPSQNYSSTLSISPTIGDTAALRFSGSRASLVFSRQRGYGKLTVLILDKYGNALVGTPFTIDENSRSTTYQDLWRSGSLGDNGPFTLKLTHASGKKVDFDAVTVEDAPETGGIGEVDDASSKLDYKGYWKPAISSIGARNGTLMVSNQVGDIGMLRFNGAQATLIFTRAAGYGTLGVSITDASNQVIAASNILQKIKRGTVNQETWRSGSLVGTGPFTLTLSHLSGGPVSLDAVIVKVAPTINSETPLIIDDAGENFNYQGYWKSSDSLSGPISGTVTSSAIIGDSAQVAFNGTRVALTYSKQVGAGILVVSIKDSGGNVLTGATITQKIKKGVSNQAMWESGVLGAPGLYTIILTHKSGGPVNIDAVTVLPAPITATSDIENNDTATIDYKGFWKQTDLSGTTNSNYAISSQAGDTARFTISGTKIGLIYSKEYGAGSIQVAITNELGFNVITPVVISEKQKSKAPLYQQSWYSDDLGTGTYTVTLTHISGVNVNLDLIKVYPSPTPGGADW